MDRLGACFDLLSHVAVVSGSRGGGASWIRIWIVVSSEGPASDEYLNYALANRNERQMRGEAVLAEMKEAIDFDFWIDEADYFDGGSEFTV